MMKRFLQRLFLQHVVFTGDFADITIKRREWAKDRLSTNPVIIVDLHYIKAKAGKRKMCRLTLFYVEDNFITRWLGFRHDEASIKLLTT